MIFIGAQELTKMTWKTDPCLSVVKNVSLEYGGKTTPKRQEKSTKAQIYIDNVKKAPSPMTTFLILYRELFNTTKLSQFVYGLVDESTHRKSICERLRKNTARRLLTLGRVANADELARLDESDWLSWRWVVLNWAHAWHISVLVHTLWVQGRFMM